MAVITQESIMSLQIKMYFQETLLSVGTGFLMRTRTDEIVLITNRHNLTGRNNETNEPLSRNGGLPNKIEIYHNSTEGIGRHIIKSQSLFTEDDTPKWKEHPVYLGRVDFVGIKLEDLNGVIVLPYSLNSNDPDIRVMVTEVISVVGFPFGLGGGGNTALWATGFVASEPQLDYNDLPLFLIDCRSRQGQSGSAVIAYRPGGMVPMANGSTTFFNGPVTKFLGIYSGRINAESDIGLVWKSRAIQELVDSM